MKKLDVCRKCVQRSFTWSPSIPTSSPWGSKVASVPERKRGNRNYAKCNKCERGQTQLRINALLLFSLSKHFSFLCKIWIRAAIQSFVHCNISIGASVTDFMHRTQCSVFKPHKNWATSLRARVTNCLQSFFHHPAVSTTQKNQEIS